MTFIIPLSKTEDSETAGTGSTQTAEGPSQHQPTASPKESQPTGSPEGDCSSKRCACHRAIGHCSSHRHPGGNDPDPPLPLLSSCSTDSKKASSSSKLVGKEKESSVRAFFSSGPTPSLPPFWLELGRLEVAMLFCELYGYSSVLSPTQAMEIE